MLRKGYGYARLFAMSASRTGTALQETFVRLVASTPGAHWVATEDPTGAIHELPWVPYGSGFEIPFYFEYEGEGAFPWKMHVAFFEGRLQCIRLECWTLDVEAPITPDLLHRFPFGRFLEEAALLASRPTDQVPRKFRLWESADEARKAHRAVAAQHRKRPAGPRRLTDETLKEVAAVYRQHIPTGRPSKAVAEHFHYTPASARRVVGEARRRGFLGPARPGRSGEQPKESDV